MQTVRGGACQSVMIGDSNSDIEAARMAGTAAVGFANRPDKYVRLTAIHPDAIIDRLADLIAADVPRPLSG